MKTDIYCLISYNAVDLLSPFCLAPALLFKLSTELPLTVNKISKFSKK